MDDTGVVRAPYLSRPLRLEPFRALSLAPSRIGDPTSARLYSRPYRGVTSRISSWLARGDLHEHRDPALYLHEYTAAGITVRGVVGILDVSHRTDGPGQAAVLPHEGVRTAQAEQLASRMRQMRVHPAPILLTYHAPGGVAELLDGVQGTPPDEQYDDHGGQHHRVWAITDEELIEQLRAAWAGQQALIADGHHRYAAYAALQGPADPGDAAATDFGLAMLIDQDDTPLQLGAIHRVLTGVNLRDLRAAAESVGAGWTAGGRETALGRLGPGVIVVSDGRGWATLEVDGTDTPATGDVGYLHDRVLPELRRQPSRVLHAHQVDAALKRARPGRDVAVLLAAPTFDTILSSASVGQLLPEKATSFQPKPHPGVLIRLLDAARLEKSRP
ncbi:DUF1015 family protein [Nocardioides albus]|uniref:DUF1015 domain-containing protein n=1 Tax=Nocardioides albus TaxID=1841 RepID=A0A7W5FB25_9ACTN|nr:DUF1015 family protein [Nocardioides albus]MBB3091914.1 hypothetical protein [Nocardioides albus]GGU32849.1 hypothetical protein GCM10007979_34710 [Nocardioides albus]